jgi:hypothetical protein
MINGKDKSENYLKNLVKKADIESPTPNFTDHVMNQILAQEQMEAEPSRKTFEIKNYYFPIVAGLGGIAYAIYYMVSHNISILSESFNPILIPIFSKIFNSIKDIFQSIQISSFTIIIIVAVVGLFIIDRLLRRFQGKQSYFSFFTF